MGMPATRNWRDLAWSGTEFCAVGDTGSRAAASENGVSWWEYLSLPYDLDWIGIASNGTVLCAVGSGSTVAATSTDNGFTWTERTLPSSPFWSAITWNGSVFCVVATGSSSAATSPDGTTWTARTLPVSGDWVDVASKDGVLVAIRSNGTTFARSTDNGATWTEQSHGATEIAWKAIAASPDGFVVVGTSTAAGRFSADGITWSEITLPSASNWTDIVWGGSTFVAVHSSSGAATGNATGSAWTARSTPSGAWLGVEWNGTLFCAIETSATIVSYNGESWSTVAPPAIVIVGTVSAPTTLTVEASLATPAAPATLTVQSLGAIVAPTTLTVVAIDTPSAPTTLTVTWPTGTPTAPTTLTVNAVGTPAAPTLLAVVPAAHVPNWTARCIIGGVDLSARLDGQARVTASEGAARIASVTLKPPSGTIEPLDYVGKPITLDYVLVIGGVEVPRRIFTGRVDTPDYDPASTLLTLTCTDDLQNIVAGLPRATLDSLIGGRYTEAVQGEIDDNWDYAQALMTTVAGSLDASPSGGLRVTPWDSATAWATLDEGGLKYERMRLALPQRSTLVNSVAIAFDYRYAHLRQRFTSMGWSGTLLDMRPNGYQYPTQQDILGAAGGSGWTPVLAKFYPAPASIPYPGGGFIYPDESAIDMAIIYLAQRHSQTVTENYTITVTAPESITANGELPHALRGALASSFDGRAWESALDVEPHLPAIGGEAGVTFRHGEMDYAPDADRTAADQAIQTLLDQARVKILGSHRSARVSNAVLCNPDLDLDKRIAIATAETTAAGKVAELVHVLDFANGSAITEFSIAVSGVGGAGIITPDTLEPPTPPDEATETQSWQGSIPSLWVNTYGVTGYTDNLMGLLLNPPETITVEDVPGEGTVVYPNPYYVAGSYPVEGFRVRMPGVIDADRNPLDKPVSTGYQILVPADPLSFIVP